MAEVKNEAGRPSGEYMIQDRDHMGETGQMGGASSNDGRRQSEQSHTGSRQNDSGQQGGEGRRQSW